MARSHCPVCTSGWTHSGPVICADCLDPFVGMVAFAAHRDDGTCQPPQNRGLAPIEHPDGGLAWGPVPTEETP